MSFVLAGDVVSKHLQWFVVVLFGLCMAWSCQDLAAMTMVIVATSAHEVSLLVVWRLER